MKKNFNFLTLRLILLVIFFTFYGCQKEDMEKAMAQSFLSGNDEETVELAKDLARYDSSNPVPHAILNILYTIKSYHNDSIEELAIKAYSSSEKIEQVIDWSAELLKNNPNNKYVLLLNAISSEKYGYAQNAEEAYIKMIEGSDSTFKMWGYIYLSRLYISHSYNIDTALVTLSRSIEIFPNFSKTYEEMGLIYKITGEVEKRIRCYEKVAELNPKRLDVLMDLAVMYLSVGDIDRYATKLNKIVKLDPNGQMGKEARRSLNNLLQNY